jgi:hypothetical protein
MFPAVTAAYSSGASDSALQFFDQCVDGVKIFLSQTGDRSTFST